MEFVNQGWQIYQMNSRRVWLPYRQLPKYVFYNTFFPHMLLLGKR